MESTVYNGQPPHNRTDTSREAATEIASESSTLRERVLTLIKNSSTGMTDWDLVHSIGRHNDTLTPRRRELVLMGLVRDSGRRRLSPANRNVKVWEVITYE